VDRLVGRARGQRVISVCRTGRGTSRARERERDLFLLDGRTGLALCDDRMRVVLASRSRAPRLVTFLSTDSP
jgi:hypothetical protein